MPHSPTLTGASRTVRSHRPHRNVNGQVAVQPGHLLRVLSQTERGRLLNPGGRLVTSHKRFGVRLHQNHVETSTAQGHRFAKNGREPASVRRRTSH